MTDKELRFFDSVASEWDSREKMSFPDKINTVLHLAGVKQGDAILDLGTGTGVLIPCIAEKIGPSGRITAVDLSVKMLEQAIAKTKNLKPEPTFLNLDFENTPIPGLYNHIFLYCVYPHLEKPIQTIRTLREQNLLPDGNIIIAFPCSADVINRIHGHNPVDSHRLMSAPELADYMRRNRIPAEVIAATEHLYIISIPR